MAGYSTSQNETARDERDDTDANGTDEEVSYGSKHARDAQEQGRPTSHTEIAQGCSQNEPNQNTCGRSLQGCVSCFGFSLTIYGPFTSSIRFERRSDDTPATAVVFRPDVVSDITSTSTGPSRGRPKCTGMPFCE